MAGPSVRPLAVITGATSGIGAEYARRYAEMGYDLLLTGRREEKINILSKDLLSAFGISVEYVLLELSETEAVAAFARRLAGDKRISVLINNAGFGVGENFSDADFHSLVRMIRVHIDASLQFTQAVLPTFRMKQEGTLIYLSSLAGFLPLPGSAVYTGSKAFLRYFGESLFMELAGSGIKVQVLCPGFTRTDFHREMDIGPDKEKGRSLPWMTPKRVVETSLKQLTKNKKPICIPGFPNKILSRLHGIFPKGLYYRVLRGVVET